MIAEEIRRICKDFTKIENYEKAVLDTENCWQCHHRLETHNSDGERRPIDLTVQELNALGMYYDRPPEELIFLITVEHHRLHNKSKIRKQRLSETMKGHTFSEESRKKISEALKGRPAWNKGKQLSEERKRRISETLKGHIVSEETRAKQSESHKGKQSPRKGKHWKLVDGKRVWY